MEFKNKNDYSCVWFFTNRKPIKWQFVHNVKNACESIKQKHGEYNFVNVYCRRGGELLRTIKKDEYIDAYPR